EMVVFDLADAFHAQGLPGEVLALAPAALPAGHARRPAALRPRPFPPGLILERVLAQGLELERELAPRGRGEGRRHADVMQPSLRVEEAEQEGAHQLAG